MNNNNNNNNNNKKKNNMLTSSSNNQSQYSSTVTNFNLDQKKRNPAKVDKQSNDKLLPTVQENFSFNNSSLRNNKKKDIDTHNPKEKEREKERDKNPFIAFESDDFRISGVKSIKVQEVDKGS